MLADEDEEFYFKYDDGVSIDLDRKDIAPHILQIHTFVT